MIIHIKYMVSFCCKKIVTQELEKLDICHGAVELGQVKLRGEIEEFQLKKLKKALQKVGFELLEDPKAIVVEQIKNAVIDVVHNSEELPKVTFSIYLSEKLDTEYIYLSRLFSETTGVTIENFIIAHKVEKVKEYIIYNELTLTEISFKLNYSSVAHLSTQFKKVTGLTPTFFKQMKHKKRTELENIGLD